MADALQQVLTCGTVAPGAPVSYELHFLVATLSELRRLVREGIPATPTQLARAAMVRRTNVYRALERLRELGFVEPAARPNGKCATWKLTARASEAA